MINKMSYTFALVAKMIGDQVEQNERPTSSDAAGFFDGVLYNSLFFMPLSGNGYTQPQSLLINTQVNPPIFIEQNIHFCSAGITRTNSFTS